MGQALSLLRSGRLSPYSCHGEDVGGRLPNAGCLASSDPRLLDRTKQRSALHQPKSFVD